MKSSTTICLIPSGLTNTINVLGLAGMVLNGDNKKLAIKHWPSTTIGISAIDLGILVTGTITGVNFKIEVQTDDGADHPSGIVLGSATAEFAGLASSGWIGLKSLLSNTGNLTLNVPVWIVIYRSSGASLSVSNYLQLRSMYGDAGRLGMVGRQRCFNGTDWTTITVTTGATPIVYKLVDNSYEGQATGIAQAFKVIEPSSQEIWGVNKLGIKLSLGCRFRITSLFLSLGRNGTPNNLVIQVYEGATLKYSQTVPVTSLLIGTTQQIVFSSPVFIEAGKNCYIIFSQESNGGNSSNDYGFNAQNIPAAYFDAIVPPGYRAVFGTGNDPTLFTESTISYTYSVFPQLDLVSDLSSSSLAGVGGL